MNDQSIKEFDVELPPNALCSIKDVKDSLQQGEINIADQYNSVIAIMISAFSEFAEKFCGRKFLYGPYTDLNQGRNIGISRHMVVSAPPIDPNMPLSVFIDPNRAFPDSSKIQKDIDFTVSYKDGTITILGKNFWDIGWYGTPNIYSMGAALYNDFYGVPRSQGVMKVEYYGGLVKPRPPKISKPLLSLNGSGSLSGTLLYRVSHVISGVETIASDMSDIDASNNQVKITVLDAPVGEKVRIYRFTQSGFRLIAEINGTGGSTIDYIDNNANVSDSTDRPFGYGPYQVPSDLRMAAAIQAADWFNKSKYPSAVSVGVGFGGGEIRYGRDTSISETANAILKQYKILRA